MYRSIALLLVAGIAAGAPLPAQDIAAWARRVDSPNRALIAVRDSRVAHRKGPPASYGQYSDSVVVASGKVKVFFNDSLAAVARAGAAAADKQLADFAGTLSRV